MEVPDLSATEISPPEIQSQIIAALKTVLDPEVGVNVYDLGLIYGIEVAANRVTITMTMTSAACPMHNLLSQLADKAVYEGLEGKYEVEVNIVFEPAWTPDLMSEDARRILG